MICNDDPPEILEAFANGRDGAHWGLTDLYPDKEEALKAALESGLPFDTGWYASKKEIATARIYRPAATSNVYCEVSVSDDFDTEGLGSAVVGGLGLTLETVYEAVGRAWDEASGDQKDNRGYAGYSLIRHTTKIPEWRRSERIHPNETRQRYPTKVAQCLDYYIANPMGLDVPPGDCYHFWGWQNDAHDDPQTEGQKCVEIGIPASTVKAFEVFAAGCRQGSIRIGDWEFKSWEDE